jgi:hypothetical protein
MGRGDLVVLVEGKHDASRAGLDQLKILVKSSPDFVVGASASTLRSAVQVCSEP